MVSKAVQNRSVTKETGLTRTRNRSVYRNYYCSDFGYRSVSLVYRSGFFACGFFRFFGFVNPGWGWVE
uniref:Uncharacterized protein n=1 Tax=Arundo donax TaxID=35708 RepID=A0A0A9G2T9_ARUDO